MEGNWMQLKQKIQEEPSGSERLRKKLEQPKINNVTNVTEWQEINLALKRKSLSLNFIGKPKTPRKCKDGSEGSWIKRHERTEPLLSSEVHLKQMEPFTSGRPRTSTSPGKKERMHETLIRSPQISLQRTSQKIAPITLEMLSNTNPCSQ
ncbi:hypothetical protein FQA39_LY12444 [Lamprigera yunnana]|nr:hypothetical protein FQA39_LY12444 [Lamprigera yunnana]